MLAFLGAFELVLIVLVLAIPVGAAFFAYRLAARKGRSVGAWTVLAFLFPLALALLALLPTIQANP